MTKTSSVGDYCFRAAGESFSPCTEKVCASCVTCVHTPELQLAAEGAVAAQLELMYGN